MKETMRAVIYTRVSTEEQAEHGTSLASQSDACTEVATRSGAEIVEHYQDAGVSGAAYATRKGLQQALADLETGRANVLIVYDVTRLSRDIEHLAAIVKRVRAANARLMFHSGQFEDTPEGEMLLGVNGIFSQYERRKLRERSIGGKIRRLQDEGKQPNVGMRPYGYILVSRDDCVAGRYPSGSQGTYVVDEREAPWVREIFTRYAAGASLREVCRFLQGSGVPPPSHAPDRLRHYDTPPRNLWHPATIQSILKNPIYVGTITYGKRRRIVDEGRLAAGYKRKDYQKRLPAEQWLTVAGCAPALVDQDTWDYCQERLQSNKDTRGGNPTSRYLLTGLLACPNCGRGLYGCHRKTYISYHCRDHSKCSRADGQICNPRYYSEKSLVEFIRAGIRQCPPLLEAAYSLYLRSQSGEDCTAMIERLQEELRACETRERATVEAELAALAAGRDASVYRTILVEVDEQKKSLHQAIARLETKSRRSQSVVLKDKAHVIEESLQELDLVLDAEEMTPGQKNAVLARLIDKIRPYDDGMEMILRPNIPGATVMRIVTRLS